MMDIVERLRRINAFLHVTEDEPEYDYKLSYEAANEIERLRGDVDRMASLAIDNARDILRLREVRDMLQAINEAKDKEIAILRAEKHLAALKEGE
jgi:hypothetical protein